MSFQPTQPHNLPLLPPKIDFKNQAFLELIAKARTELGELKGLTFSMPNPLLLISPAVIKESVASSNIENINTTVVEVLQNQLFPEVEQKQPDKEVLHYRDAIMWGFEQLPKIPISTRLILGIKHKLLPTSPEDYRQQQNKIENSSTHEVLYTPPIATNIGKLMGNWETFINQQDESVDVLIRCAVCHYQFEAIHPFSDGNGRTGRILMVLSLIQAGLLNFPSLYISGYINQNRSEYYRLLRDVTIKENWHDFIVFMLNGFYLQAKDTKETLMKVMSLFFEFKRNLKANFPKIYSADFVEILFSYPIITPVKLSDLLGVHYTTASKYLTELASKGVLKEGKYGKYHLFINEQLMKILRK